MDVMCFIRALRSLNAGLLLLWLAFAPWSAAGFWPATSNGADDFHWVATWTAMPQLVEPHNLPPEPFTTNATVFHNATLRQTLRTSIGASRIRLQISNAFGLTALPVTAASLALPLGGEAGIGEIEDGTAVDLTFDGGSGSVTIPAGEVAYTDPVDFDIGPQSMLAIDLYLENGQRGAAVTGHPGSRTTSWMQGGDLLAAPSIPGLGVEHWYFLTAIEAWAPGTTSALVVLGDSISDGRGSDDNKNNRWPDLVLAKMQAAGIDDVAVVNQAAGGNAVLSGGLGPPLVERYGRDLLEVAGARYALVFEGVNDIGPAPDDAAAQDRVVADLVGAFRAIAADARDAGLAAVFGATITPFSGEDQAYSGLERERARRAVNDWILGGGGGGDGGFDAAIDFAAVLADPEDASVLAAEYDGGDHLHPNVAGYQAIADAFPLEIFDGRHEPTPSLPKSKRRQRGDRWLFAY